MRVIVVDDDPCTVMTLAGCLEQLGHEVATAENGREAYDLLQQGDFRVVISDWEMPEMNGVELCRLVRRRHLGPYVYMALLTSRSGRDSLLEGLDAGADDFITKPVEPDELRVRLRAAERVTALESRDLVIFSLAKLAESRDMETGAHLERIREYARVLATELSRSAAFRDQIDADFVKTIYLTSPLHDIGKVGIPDYVLLKPGPFEPHEFEIMKQHAAIGRDTLEAALEAHPQATFLRVARDIAWCHHERFDGSGYPRGLCGLSIPLSARIVAICDVYDAVTSKRHYKPSYSHEFAVEEIARGRGTAFDPGIVDSFLHVADRFNLIREAYGGDTDSFMSPLAEPVLAG